MLKCLLADGSVDLDKVQEAATLMKQLRMLRRVSDALYNGYVDKGAIRLVVRIEPPDYASSDAKHFDGRPLYPEPSTEEIGVEIADIEDLVRNKARMIADRIEELGFST